MKLLDMNPIPGAFTADPLTATEIDAHPDADRIWATLMAAKLEVEKAWDAGYYAACALVAE